MIVPVQTQTDGGLVEYPKEWVSLQRLSLEYRGRAAKLRRSEKHLAETRFPQRDTRLETLTPLHFLQTLCSSCRELISR